MPGRTPPEAFKAFVDPLASALACVARCKLSPSAGGRQQVDVVHHLLGNDGEVIEVGGPYHLRLRVRMKYMIVRQDDLEGGPFKIRTLAYSYSLTSGTGGEIVSYHWHPDSASHVKSPHAHLGHGQLSSGALLTPRTHLPTGRVSLEQVVRSLITEHEVTPRADDWDARLTLSHGVFELYRSWS